MDQLKFEQLIRQLFEKRGLKSWTAQSSRDDGVDGVVVNEDPVMGGVCIIQVKRYKNAVSPNDVRALAGSIEDMRASKGILVKMSWFGSAGRRFAARHGRIQLIEGAELKHLLKEHLGLDVRLDLLKPPPRRR